MKETIVRLLQRRMEKCTSDQFWAVGALTGLNVFVISQRENVVAAVPYWVILVITTVATVFGASHIIRCHRNYLKYRDAQAELLQDEPGVPDFLKTSPDPWKSLLGVGFYVVWIVLMWLLSLIAYL